MDHDQLAHNFTYHPPTQEKVAVHELLRTTGFDLAMVINCHVKDCPEKDEAIKKVEEAVMWANAAVARSSG